MSGGLRPLFLHSTPTLNSQQQLQELLSPWGEGWLRPLGFHPLALEEGRDGRCG